MRIIPPLRSAGKWWLMALMALAFNAQALQVPNHCDEIQAAQQAGAERDANEISQLEKARKQAAEAATGCLSRAMDSIIRAIPGIPSMSTMSMEQIIKILADKACQVATESSVRKIQTVSGQVQGQVNQVGGQVRTQTKGVADVTPTFGSSGLPTKPAPAPTPSTTPAGSSTSVWDKMGSIFK